MRASRQSNRQERHGCRARDSKQGRDAGALRRRAFTLVELILVLVLLAIIATFVAAKMGSFFQGRALNFEARRLLSLTHYAQSRAVSEGVPMIVWVNPADSTYGLTLQASFNDPEGDAHAVTYTADPSVQLQTPQGEVTPESEQQDEKLGVTTDGVMFIRFNPDGFFDEASVSKITLRQGADAGLELVPMTNRLGYEIRPATND
jgi:type II secretion system protein H